MSAGDGRIANAIAQRLQHAETLIRKPGRSGTRQSSRPTGSLGISGEIDYVRLIPRTVMDHNLVLHSSLDRWHCYLADDLCDDFFGGDSS